MKTNTVRMAQGVQARITSARGCTTGGGATWPSPPSFSWPLSDTEVQMFFGCQIFRKDTSEIIETTAAITSTSSGPM